MAIQIPKDGFEIKLANGFEESVNEFKKVFRSNKSLEHRFNEVLRLLPKDTFNSKLKFHSLINKASNIGGNKKYNYTVTIQGKYRLAFYFDEGNSNPDETPPKTITLFYIGNYH